MKKMLRHATASFAFAVVATGAIAQCARFPAAASSAFDTKESKITLPWRTDLPLDAGKQSYGWQSQDFTSDWKAYMASILTEIKAAGVSIRNGRIVMNQKADWWIAPWMDFGRSGRERINGLTAERGPDAGDLSPTSSKGYETWAIGWYNRPGAFGLRQIFADPCDPQVPAGWRFPDQTASFKLLFSNASTTEVTYLVGAPEVEADTKRNNDPLKTTRLRLIQLDVAVRDPSAHDTGWVMGTYVWRGPAKGDGLFDNLVPVGLMWGNDPRVLNADWAAFAAVKQSKINEDLAGVIWQGNGVLWPERPFPGFQGRLNGAADNLRSSCISCHAMAQWRRGPLGLAPSYPINPKLPPQSVQVLVDSYFRNILGGKLVDPASGQTPLDYSLQLEAGFLHLCDACNQEKLAGATPKVCQAPSLGPRDVVISRPTCDKNVIHKLLDLFSPRESGLAIMPRQ